MSGLCNHFSTENTKVLSNFSPLQPVCLHVPNFKLRLDSREELLRKIFTFDYCSVAESCPTLCDLMDCSMLGFPVLDYLLELRRLMSIELVMPSSHLILLSPSIFHSIGNFSSELYQNDFSENKHLSLSPRA